MCAVHDPAVHYYALCSRARAHVYMFGGINFGNLVKNSPIRQIKILAKVSGYTVFTKHLDHYSELIVSGMKLEMTIYTYRKTGGGDELEWLVQEMDEGIINVIASFPGIPCFIVLIYNHNNTLVSSKHRKGMGSFIT